MNLHGQLKIRTKLASMVVLAALTQQPKQAERLSGEVSSFLTGVRAA